MFVHRYNLIHLQIPAILFPHAVLISILFSIEYIALSAVIVSAVIKNVVMPKKLMQLKGIDFLVGVVTAFTTAVTSPTLGFGCGVILYTVIRLSPKKKVV